MKANTTQSNNKRTRNSAIELLRIFSMFAIVLCHFATHGSFRFSSQSITIPRLWWSFIEMGGNFGVDVFVLISGYFLIDNKNTYFSFTKTMRIWGQIVFYSIFLFVFSFFIGYGRFNLRNIIQTFFPITFSTWWFASTYFVLFLLHPYINKLLHNLEKKQYQKLLIILTICWCIIPTLTNKKFQLSPLLEFVYLYSIAGYIKIYGINHKLKSSHCLGLFCIFTFITYLSCVFFMVAGTKIASFSNHSLYFYERNKLPTLAMALFIFIFFIKMKPFCNNGINKVASATFGVYLLHDSPLLRRFFWIDIFKNASFQNSIWIIFYSIGVCILIYSVCTLMDLARQKFIEGPYMNLLSKHQSKIIRPISFVYDKARKIIFDD